MSRNVRIIICIASGATLLQFGGCLAGQLADVFFAIGPTYCRLHGCARRRIDAWPLCVQVSSELVFG